MAQFDELLNADAARRAAMVTADMDALASYLHDDLIWTHSSGKTDDKAALLNSIESGSADFRSLDTRDTNISQHRGIYIFNGIVEGDVVKDGTPKRLQNKFLSVWLKVESGLQMVAWQSTGI